MKEILFLDIGNSLIKIKINSNLFSFNFKNLSSFYKFLLTYRNQKIIGIITNQIKAKKILKFLKTKKFSYEFLTTNQIVKYIHLNQKINYKQLGIDLALMGYYAQFKNFNNVLICCYGTYSTFINIQDNVIQDIGILPGFELSNQLIKKISSTKNLFCNQGCDNNHVFGYGNYLNVNGLIDFCLNQNKKIIITGGFSNLVIKNLKNKNYIHLSELTLISLELYINNKNGIN